MSLAGTSTIVGPVVARDTTVADLGNYYTASTVPGTGLIAHAVNSTFVETKPVFMIYNGGSLSIYPMFLRITCTVAGTGNPTILSAVFTTTLDQGNRFSAFVTGNTISPVNVNMNSPNTSGAQISVGAITATAATANRRLVSHRPVRPTAAAANTPIAGDVYQFSYGSGELVDPAGLPTDGSNRTHVVYVIAPLVITSGNSMLLYFWAPTSSAGPTFEYEIGYVEK